MDNSPLRQSLYATRRKPRQPRRPRLFVSDGPAIRDLVNKAVEERACVCAWKLQLATGAYRFVRQLAQNGTLGKDGSDFLRGHRPLFGGHEPTTAIVYSAALCSTVQHGPCSKERAKGTP